ncbi:kinase-like domain-containing protein [Rhizophagus clarus]|uniref:Kinase-like domain-containing protein n=1 Tax=Rhizophagus clarus TaxID=94130 RepID=A0A8H3LCP1_9GLOM|nr:kinase-like domain-containing protein [Rhizophagus clarus]
MQILKRIFKKKKSLWKDVNYEKYQGHVFISSNDSTTKSEEIDNNRIVYIEDIEKRKEIYGICGECNEPGTGEYWCQPCNAKRFKKNFKNWTSGNKDIDDLIQHSQINAVHYKNCFEWIPYENFQNVNYITKGSFAKIYLADWPEVQDFLNEAKSHLQIYLWDIIQCFGITQDPNTKNYMMVLYYCKDGNLRNNYLNDPENDMKLYHLLRIANGLLDIHNAGKVHKDFHLGNILYDGSTYISDLGMCQSANDEMQPIKNEGVYGVLPYIAPEVLRGYQCTKAADIYSFGIMMNEYLSEEIPFIDIPHDHVLAVKICKGLRPKIPEDVPKFLADLTMICCDAKAEDRPTAKELYQLLYKWNNIEYEDNEIYSQMKKYEKIRENKLKNRSSKNKPKNIVYHPQAIYSSRLLNFKNLPEPENSSDLSTYQLNSGDCLI